MESIETQYNLNLATESALHSASVRSLPGTELGWPFNGQLASAANANLSRKRSWGSMAADELPVLCQPAPTIVCGGLTPQTVLPVQLLSHAEGPGHVARLCYGPAAATTVRAVAAAAAAAATAAAAAILGDAAATSPTLCDAIRHLRRPALPLPLFPRPHIEAIWANPGVTRICSAYPRVPHVVPLQAGLLHQAHASAQTSPERGYGLCRSSEHIQRHPTASPTTASTLDHDQWQDDGAFDEDNEHDASDDVSSSSASDCASQQGSSGSTTAEPTAACGNTLPEVGSLRDVTSGDSLMPGDLQEPTKDCRPQYVQCQRYRLQDLPTAEAPRACARGTMRGQAASGSRAGGAVHLTSALLPRCTQTGARTLSGLQAAEQPHGMTYGARSLLLAAILLAVWELEGRQGDCPVQVLQHMMPPAILQRQSQQQPRQ